MNGPRFASLDEVWASPPSSKNALAWLDRPVTPSDESTHPEEPEDD